jgi:hypothetical protein
MWAALAIVSAVAWPSWIHAAEPSKDIERIVFEEQRIEGKIRRPQLVLIRAEERPHFTPMVMQALADTSNIVDFVSESVIEASPYDDAFDFRGTAASGYAP